MRDRVEDEAARWALRDALTAREQVALDAWLARNWRHSGALLRAQAALSTIDRALVPDEPAESETAPPVANALLAPTRRWVVGGLSSAAAAALGLIGWRTLRGERVMTVRGEIRRLPLVDGSVATIDTESELHVAMTGQTRRIVIAHGQAWFQVAKDRNRPFVVDAGIAQVRAVGTAFSVRRDGDQVEVAVTEGTVVAWPAGAKGTMNVLTEGQYATFSMNGETPRTGTAPAEIDRALAWRDGEISLEGETLSSAVLQFNRYNEQQLVLVDPDLGKERLVGLFKVGNPQEFASMLEKTLGIAVTIIPHEIRLSRKYSHPV
jgi:transmembrane sensor